jgi:formate hydrogenlyase subunit 4
MNGVLGFVLAVVVYPGVLAAIFAAWLLGWARASARGAVAGSTAPNPLRAVREIRSDFGRDTITPEGVHSAALVLGSSLAVACPLVALFLLPVPGNPLIGSLGLTGDLVAEGALLLGVPVARLLVDWAIPSPYTRIAADRGARLLAGVAVPMALALTASAEQLGTLGLDLPPTRIPLPTISLVTRILAALAFAVTLPALARTTTLRGDAGALELGGGELSEISGRDLACFRIGEALQLVAVASVFVAAFVLPIFITAPAGAGRGLVWIIGVVVTAAGIGAWEGYASRHPTASRAPLSWWMELPLLLALVALVAAAWASRGA